MGVKPITIGEYLSQVWLSVLCFANVFLGVELWFIYERYTHEQEGEYTVTIDQLFIQAKRRLSEDDKFAIFTNCCKKFNKQLNYENCKEYLSNCETGDEIKDFVINYHI
jgi:NADPH-dependent 7-cyano-7-deazaguanine reductase QueF-like protein